MFQPRQHDLLASLFNLAREKHFIKNCVDLNRLISEIKPSPPRPGFPPSLPNPEGTLLTHLVKIKDQIQLAHIPKELVQHLDKEVDGLQVGELVVVGVDTHAEEEARVPAIDDFRGRQVLAGNGGGARGGGRGPELHEVGLVFLVTGRYQAMDLRCISVDFSSAWLDCPPGSGRASYFALELDLLFVGIWGIPFCEASLALAILD
jgi:hypothetical protein